MPVMGSTPKRLQAPTCVQCAALATRTFDGVHFCHDHASDWTAGFEAIPVEASRNANL